MNDNIYYSETGVSGYSGCNKIIDTSPPNESRTEGYSGPSSTSIYDGTSGTSGYSGTKSTNRIRSKKITKVKPDFHIYLFENTRNKKRNNNWFPNGWAVNIHDLGLPSDPYNSYDEWEYGNISSMIDNGMWWINYVYAIPISNMQAWNRPMQRNHKQWTTLESFTRLLDFLQKKYIESNGRINIKAILPVASKFDECLSIFLPGHWHNIPNGIRDEFVRRIKSVCDHERLAGWMLIDEPYAGDKARQLGKRNEIYNELLSIKNSLISLDDNIDKHPIWVVIRGYGNYDFDPKENPQYISSLNQVRNIGDYIIDDLYLGDFLNDGENGQGKFIGRIKNRCVNARKTLLEKQKNIPDLGLKKAYMVFSQGMNFSPCKHPINGNGYLTTNELRYQNYCSWINGANGCGFWYLSKSDETAFNIIKPVSYEAFKCTPFLLNKDIKNLKQAYITHEKNKNIDVQFTLRKDPENQNILLLLICRNDYIDKESKDFNLYIPDKKLKHLRKLIDNYYSWTGYITADNSVSITLKPREAQAYIIYTEDI